MTTFSLKLLRQTRGMTLVELMVAVTVTVVVMTLSISVFTAQYKSYRIRQSTSGIEETAPVVLDLLKSDLMAAGWSVTQEMAFYIKDGGAGGSDEIFINDYSLMELEVCREKAALTAVVNDCAGCVTIIQPTTPLVVTDTDVDGDGCDDFVVNVNFPQYVISDSSQTRIAKVVGTTPGPNGTLTLDQNPPFSGGEHIAPAIHYSCAQSGGIWQLLRSYRRPNTPNGVCYPAPLPQLCLPVPPLPPLPLVPSPCCPRNNVAAGELPMAENIVDLQVAYRDDAGTWWGAPGCVAGVGCEQNPFKPETINLIRITLLARDTSSGAVRDITRINDPNYCRPAGENRVAAALGSAECGYSYRRYTAVIYPRNYNSDWGKIGE